MIIVKQIEFLKNVRGAPDIVFDIKGNILLITDRLIQHRWNILRKNNCLSIHA